jgi:AhpD family alkylhydroperoxidase
MDTRTKELIAIGASVTANCVPCLRFHFEKAREVGVEETDIHTAVRVGRLVRKGAASVWDGEAETLLGTEDVAVSVDQEEAAQSCGCS